MFLRHITHFVALLLYRSSSALRALRALSVLGVWLYLAPQAQAAETVSLIEILDRANQQGLHVAGSTCHPFIRPDPSPLPGDHRP
jgi:hypothetical protein